MFTYLYTHLIYIYGVFFSSKKCALYLKKKMQFCVCFLKMFHPLKGWYVFQNNLHFPTAEGIAFYVLYKSKVPIIPCKAYDSCLFIGLPDEIYKKSPDIVIPF